MNETNKPTLKQRAAPTGQGACCWICGRGATPRLGPAVGARAVLADLGYEIPPGTQPRAHVPCMERERAGVKS